MVKTCPFTELKKKMFYRKLQSEVQQNHSIISFNSSDRVYVCTEWWFYWSLHHNPTGLIWQIIAGFSVMLLIALTLCMPRDEAEKTRVWLAVPSHCLQGDKEMVVSLLLLLSFFFPTMIYRACLFWQLHSFNLWSVQCLWSKGVPPNPDG